VRADPSFTQIIRSTWQLLSQPVPKTLSAYKPASAQLLCNQLIDLASVYFSMHPTHHE
jgi:hypothetical protein